MKYFLTKQDKQNVQWYPYLSGKVSRLFFKKVDFLIFNYFLCTLDNTYLAMFLKTEWKRLYFSFTNFFLLELEALKELHISNDMELNAIHFKVRLFLLGKIFYSFIKNIKTSTSLSSIEFFSVFVQNNIFLLIWIHRVIKWRSLSVPRCKGFCGS